MLLRSLSFGACPVPLLEWPREAAPSYDLYRFLSKACSSAVFFIDGCLSRLEDTEASRVDCRAAPDAPQPGLWMRPLRCSLQNCTKKHSVAININDVKQLNASTTLAKAGNPGTPVGVQSSAVSHYVPASDRIADITIDANKMDVLVRYVITNTLLSLPTQLLSIKQWRSCPSTHLLQMKQCLAFSGFSIWQ